MRLARLKALQPGFSRAISSKTLGTLASALYREGKGRAECRPMSDPKKSPSRKPPASVETGSQPPSARAKRAKKSSVAPLMASTQEHGVAPALVETECRSTDSRPPVPSALSMRPGSLSAVACVSSGAQRTLRSARATRRLVDDALAVDRASLKLSVAGHVAYTQGKDELSATAYDYFAAAARATRDRLFERWNRTQQAYYCNNRRRVYYLSMEYLLGRLFEDSLLNLGIHEAMAAALGELRVDMAALVQAEPEVGLGTGGLGRLAACLVDSSATLGLPCTGYGIRYEYGCFEQQIVDGKQVERADNWLRYGSPWEVQRPDKRYLVQFGGKVAEQLDAAGRLVFVWRGDEQVWAVANDYLVPGFGNETVNTLRLWAAKATRGFSLDYVTGGDYIRAVEAKYASENLSRVLFPADSAETSRELRLKQEYFLVTATIKDAIARHQKSHSSLATLADDAVFQLNDTQPGVAVAELMRLLIDEYGFVWDEAWAITTRAMAYTNHAVAPEALELWPVALFEAVLPRHLQIIYEINNRFLVEVRARFPGDEARVIRMSLFGDEPVKHLRMAHLCLVGAFAVNGGSELHGRILRDRLFRDFAELWPQKFLAITHGITPRRWLKKCNPGLAELITARIGDKWTLDLYQLRRLGSFVTDPEFLEQFRQVKRVNKQRLATVLKELYRIEFDPSSLLDVHLKPIHEYQRQLLNILHVVALYLNSRTGLPKHNAKRTFLFAGKAAPGAAAAKEIIQLIVAVARVIDDDPVAKQWLKVIFVPNYGVSLAELIVPAADLSEQIALAGAEASGTGALKLALNGALTIGTAGGANLELLEAVGSRNFFQFGRSASEVEGIQSHECPQERNFAPSAELSEVLDAVASGLFSPEEPKRFSGLVATLLAKDRVLVLADFASYRICHQHALEVWGDQDEWARRSIMNTCNMGRFSSDEVIRSYARDIWKVEA